MLSSLTWSKQHATAKMAAGMGAAQLALDAVAMAISSAMGSDPAVPPSPGMILGTNVTVLVGGMPMPNIPNPALHLLERLRGRLARLVGRRPRSTDDGHAGTVSCPRGGA